MIPTREQFKDFIEAIKTAQEKEDNVNKALGIIPDDS